MDLHSLLALVIYFSEVWLHSLYHNSPHVINRHQESRSIDDAMKSMNCIPEQNIIMSLLSIYLSYTLFTKYQSRIHRQTHVLVLLLNFSRTCSQSWFCFSFWWNFSVIQFSKHCKITLNILLLMKIHHPLISVVHKIPITCQENQWVNIISSKYTNNHVG